jgi:3-deoxy-D-manno-octulosonic acid kinase
VDPPAGYERIECDGARLMLRCELSQSLVTLGVSDPVALIERSPAEGIGGREPLGRINLGGEGSLLVRALSRGGLWGKLVRRLSWDSQRAENELRVSAEAAARGAAVPEVVAAITRRVAGGYEHGLISRELLGARDLVAVLRGERYGRTRWAALRAAGLAVAGLHAAGVDHVDLNLKNVLIDADGRGVVIDLDRCQIAGGEAGVDVRERNLLRLYRSWVKLGVAEPQSVHPRDPLRFLRGYSEHAPTRQALVARGRAASFATHRLRWALFPPRFR